MLNETQEETVKNNGYPILEIPLPEMTQILIFKTNIEMRWEVDKLELILKDHPKIFKWSIDQEDVDNVLRIEGKNTLSEADILQLIRVHGFNIDILRD